MEAQQFLAEFGHIANAPNGISKLRELVLVLAMQGRLISQWPGETSRTVLEKIAAEKDAPLGRDAARPTRPLPPIVNLEKRDSIPQTWTWVRFGDIAIHNSGKTLDSVRNSGHSRDYITTSNLYWGRFDLQNVRRMLIRDDELERCTARKNDLLICEGGEAGRAAVWSADLEVCFQNHIHRARFYAGISPHFACRFFEKLNATGEINAHRKGIGISNLSSKALAMIPMPLPPIEEQSRIVVKIDELMTLCDKLEAQQQERRKLQNALRQSTLQAVAKATSPHELQMTWARLEANFGSLFSEPGDVVDVIAEVRNLAVRGLLAEHSPANSTLDAIKVDCSRVRQQYVEDRLMRRQKLVDMAATEATYPQHWAVAAFDEVAIVIGGVTKGRDLRGKKTVTCRYLSVANVQRGYFKLDELKSIEITPDEVAKYEVKEGDLLITEGGDWDKVGRTAIWRGGIDNCLHQNHIFKARIPSDGLLKEWVELVFNSGIGRDYFAGASKQTTNLASINMTQLRSFPLPVPPLDEQERILASVLKLTAQCGEWRRQLERKQALSALLSNVVVASLTGIAIEQDEDEQVKAPQTELVSPLRLGKAPDVKAQAPLATLLTRNNGEMSARDLWQRFGGEIDAFYAQLKSEVAHGWILEPTVAQMRERNTETAA